MKTFVSLIMLISLSPSSYAFIPKMQCWREADPTKVMYVEYADDGIIEMTFDQKSCELDYESEIKASNNSWVKFVNNNWPIKTGSPETICHPMVSQFVQPDGEFWKVDMKWFVINENVLKQELKEFKAELGYDFWEHSDGNVVVVESLDCRVVENK